MPDTLNYGWNLPTVGADLDVWGDENNAAWMLCDAEMFKKANSANPVFTGIVAAPAFVGNPSAILRPTVDSATAIQLQNAAAAIQASMNTTTGAMTFVGPVIAPRYSAVASVIIRPGADAAGAIQFQNLAGGIIGQINTGPAAQLSVVGSVLTPLYTAQSTVAIRPGADSATAIQMQNAAGTAVVNVNTSASVTTFTGSVFIGASPGYGGVLTATGNGSTVETGTGLKAVAMFRSITSHGSIIVETQGSPNASNRRRALVWSNGIDDLFISRLPADGSAAIHDIYVNTSGNVGIGTITQATRLQVSGGSLGAQDHVFTPSINGPNSVLISDTNGTGGSGGGAMFGANNQSFAAIRGHYTNAASYGSGDLSFYTRTNPAVEALTELIRLTDAGLVCLRFIPISAPAAGSRAIWCDTAAGNVLKLAL